MNRIEVPYTHGLATTLARMERPGIILASTRPSGESNVMTIGWGYVGFSWGFPVFVTMVRHSRYTFEFIEESGEFTVNVPADAMRRWVGVCGSRSGRDVNKLADYDISVSRGHGIASITLDESPLVYECKVVHYNDIVPAQLKPEIDDTAYADRDYHRLYYGRIIGAYADPSYE